MPFDLRFSSTGGRDADDWLGGVGEIDWSDDAPRPHRSSGGGPEQLPPTRAAEGARGEDTQDHAVDRAIRRRRAIGLAVILVLVGGLIWLAVAMLGGGSDESTSETTQSTTVLQPAASTPTQTTETTTPPVVTAPPLTVTLAEGEKLRRDSTGDAVTQLQDGLTALGLEPGPSDGDFGPLTEAAVIEFQQSHGLDVDGVVGVETAGALNDALAALPASASTG